MSSLPTIFAFSCYLLLMFSLGWMGYRSTKNLSDYILGGRSLNSFVTALAAGASDMSGWLMMGLPGALFLTGISGAWAAVGLLIGAWTNWKVVAARLRLFTEKFGNALTLPEYFSNRFQDNTNILRIVSAVAILIFFSIYCSSGMVASARLFEVLFGMDYQVALWIGAVATISYVMLGGFLAVSWTDTIQASLMFFALLAAPALVIYSLGGFQPTFESLNMASALHEVDYTSITGNLSVITIISLLGWGLGYFGQPHVLARFMASASPKTIPTARRISMTWMFLCLAGSVSIGFFGIAYFSANPDIAQPVLDNPESIFLEITKLLFNPWIGGIVLAGILSAIMSTLSAQILVCSSALTEDIYKTFLRKKASQKELVWIGRFMVLGVALVAIWLAYSPDSKILQMVSYAWAGFGAAFGPLIILSVTWKRINFAGALSGIIVGTVTVIVWKQFAWFDLYEIIPGFIFAMLAIIVVSKMTKAPSASTYKVFDEVSQELRALGRL